MERVAVYAGNPSVENIGVQSAEIDFGSDSENGGGGDDDDDGFMGTGGNVDGAAPYHVSR